MDDGEVFVFLRFVCANVFLTVGLVLKQKTSGATVQQRVSIYNNTKCVQKMEDINSLNNLD